MNVLHLSSSESIGGAAKACSRISLSLNEIGVESKILTQLKNSKSSSVYDINNNKFEEIKTKTRILMDYILIKTLTKQERGRFSFPYVGTKLLDHPAVKSADIINLHWINGGYINLKSIKNLLLLNKPIVWTFHDMWTFTGGCHYTGDCNNYLTECKNCPSLKFKNGSDFSNKIFRDKEEIFNKYKFNIVTCSKWLANEAKRSHLLRDYHLNVIPNPINLKIFKPVLSNEARQKLNLPENKLLFLFSSFTVNEKRKGFDYLINSLNGLYNEHGNLKDKIELVVLGAADANTLNKIPFKINIVGRINDSEKIALYYSAADLFIAPSLQENLSNTVMESLSCGTPVLAFNIGGMPDMIDHEQNGYLAAKIGMNELIEGALWFINLDENSKQNLRTNARNKVVENFSPLKIANQYKELYEKLLNPS